MYLLGGSRVPRIDLFRLLVFFRDLFETSPVPRIDLVPEHFAGIWQPRGLCFRELNIALAGYPFPLLRRCCKTHRLSLSVLGYPPPTHTHHSHPSPSSSRVGNTTARTSCPLTRSYPTRTRTRMQRERRRTFQALPKRPTPLVPHITLHLLLNPSLSRDTLTFPFHVRWIALQTRSCPFCCSTHLAAQPFRLVLAAGAYFLAIHNRLCSLPSFAQYYLFCCPEGLATLS